MSHADTIRRVLNWPMAYFSVAESEEAHAALDALVAERDLHQAEAVALGCKWDALVAEIQQQPDRIAWLEGDVAGWRIKLAAAQTERDEWKAEAARSKWPKEAAQEFFALRAEKPRLVAANQQLRDALERMIAALNGVLARKPVRDVSETLAEARAALDGTPSAAQTLEDPPATERAEASSNG